jgi:hypothetical protein
MPVRWARNTVKWAPIPLARYHAEWQRAALPGATIVVARALNKRATPGSLKWWQFAHYVNHMPVADLAAAGIRPEWFARDLRYGHLRAALRPKAAAAKAAS